MNAPDTPPASARGWIANPRDFFGALGLLLLALFVLWATLDLPGQEGFQLGAGSVPRLFALLLGANALLVMASAAFTRGPTVRYSLPAALAAIALCAAGLAAYWIAGAVIAVLSMAALAFLFMRKLDEYGIRAPVFVAIGILAFGLFVKPLGLAIAVFALVVISAAATREFKLVESLIWGAVLGIFSAVFFIFLLNLPIAALPPVLLSK